MPSAIFTLNEMMSEANACENALKLALKSNLACHWN